MTYKLIQDPIHGYIKFSGDCLKIIDSVYFKRLQNIKQLGLAYLVYPGASHNRFEHSLGVAHLCEKFLNSLKKNNPQYQIDDRDIELVKIAGLVHDLGHGPFSHCFDNRVVPIISQVPNDHETRSCLLFDFMIRELGLNISPSESKFIQKCISPKKNDIIQDKMGFLYQILSNPINGIDVDRFDYLKRDTYNIGLDYSFDCDQLINEAKIIDNKIVFPKKLCHQILNMFYVRYNLHRDICNHPTVRVIEYMVADALIESNKFLKFSKTLDNICFYRLNDNITFLIRNFPDDTLLKANQILDRIDTRNLYHYHGEINISDDERFNTMLKEKSNELGITEEDYIIDKIDVRYTKNENPLEDIYLYDSKNDTNYFTMNTEDINRIFPSCNNQNVYRVYSRSNYPKVDKLFSQLTRNSLNPSNVSNEE